MRWFRNLWLISLMILVVGLVANCGGSAPLLDQPNNPSVTTADQSGTSPAATLPSQPLDVGPTMDVPATNADIGVSTPGSSDMADRSVSSTYSYRGYFSSGFYLPPWGRDTAYIFWRSDSGVGTWKLWYMTNQLVVDGARIDLYYQDKSSYWSWVWFDRLAPVTWWRSRNIYVGSGTVTFKFVISNPRAPFGQTVYLKMTR